MTDCLWTLSHLLTSLLSHLLRQTDSTIYKNFKLTARAFSSTWLAIYYLETPSQTCQRPQDPSAVWETLGWIDTQTNFAPDTLHNPDTWYFKGSCNISGAFLKVNKFGLSSIKTQEKKVDWNSYKIKEWFFSRSSWCCLIFWTKI
jgi:hypothetical protein